MFNRQGDFTKKVTDLPDRPSPQYLATEIKTYFQTPADELKTTVNKLMDDLETSTASASIGAKDESGVTTTVQGQFDHLNLLKADNIRVADVENRLDNIVGQAGTSNTEIVDARYDSVNDKTYTTLGNRLNGVNQQLADIATNVKNFSSSIVNGDWTPAFKAAHDSLPANGGKIVFNGSYTIKSPLVFTKRIVLDGSGHTNSNASNDQGASVLIKNGNFVGITVQGNGSVLQNFQLDGETGNGNDGIIVASSRTSLEHVTVTNQGGNGVRIGNDTSANCNVWRIKDLVTLYNGGHGLLVHDSQQQTLPNTNAGLLIGVDSRNNGGDGVHVGYGIDCAFIGICAQYNTGYGVQLADYARGIELFSTYTEANTAGDIILTTNASKNMVWGFREGTVGDSIVDNGSLNFIMGRDSQTGGLPFFKSPFAVQNFSLQNTATSGNWNFTKDSATRDLVLQLLGTSASANIRLKGGVGQTLNTQVDNLTINTGTAIKNHFSTIGTLNFGTSVPANSAVFTTRTITGVNPGDMVTATPTSGTIETGLVWNAYVSAANTVTVRIANVTTSAVTITSQGWRVDVWLH